ncbi:SPASM domain-containing protein [Alkalibacter rhizosphaerae]|uniref:SPASM domain-containing protein n=1 Tax=Alkalibacter rhizosphaerae TaxID=2815577 RepID=A0A974XDJ2_9FIRM|nr:SPASM domain-containing protein [Alkalibacter rhizosphaerae]QSX07843.1 SPASM domain-containing protein [Alkalibacter rhizosphaerae]
MKLGFDPELLRYRREDPKVTEQMKKKRPPQREVLDGQHMRKLYVEPTARCNLHCDMCPRHTWIDEPMGDMTMEVYTKLLKDVEENRDLECIFFGGVAEPMSHPRIIEMVRLAKELHLSVELISNGSMLHEKNITALLDAGLDKLWISLDSQHMDSEEKTTGANGFQRTKKMLQTFQQKKTQSNPYAQLGISFVATKSNIHMLPEVVEMARVSNVEEVKVSNLIPYTADMESEVLYQKSLACDLHKEDPNNMPFMLLNLPIMDFEDIPAETLKDLMRQKVDLQMGKDRILRRNRFCPFIESDSVFVRWDGEVSPCLALLHTNKTYLQGMERTIYHCSYGNVKERSFMEIWTDPEYAAFRNKVKEFAFSPCPTCGHCTYAEENMEDCYGNEFPTCGACMWAEGFAQCP